MGGEGSPPHHEVVVQAPGPVPADRSAGRLSLAARRLYWRASLDPELRNVRWLGSVLVGLVLGAVVVVLRQVPPAAGVLTALLGAWVLFGILTAVVYSAPQKDRQAGSEMAHRRLRELRDGLPRSTGARGPRPRRTTASYLLAGLQLVLAIALLSVWLRPSWFPLNGVLWFVLLVANGLAFWAHQRTRYRS